MSLATDPLAASAVQSNLKELFKLIKTVNEARKSLEPNLQNINSLSAELKKTEKLSPTNKTRLKGYYDEAIRDADREEELLRKSLDKIYQIRRIRHEMRLAARNAGNKETIRRGALMKMLATSAETIPLWVGKEGESPPPLCGAIPPESNFVAAAGDMAAALVRSTDGDGDENWILAEVVSYNPTSGKYEVDDIDEEQKDRHLLSRRKVVPLPTRRACPETNPEALYPPGWWSCARNF